MSRLFAGLLLVALFGACGPRDSQTSAAATLEVTNTVVEASCGQCQFGLKAPGCDLAVRIDGKAYFVEGAGIDDYGNAHAEDGFCNAVREATVTGEIRDGRFQPKSFVLLPSGDR